MAVLDKYAAYDQAVAKESPEPMPEPSAAGVALHTLAAEAEELAFATEAFYQARARYQVAVTRYDAANDRVGKARAEENV